MELHKRGPVWLFDVDGTLTPPRGTIDYDFSQWFYRFASTRDVRIVTGGDRARIMKQLGRQVVERLSVSYNCLGNSVWMHGMEVDRLQFEAPTDFDSFVQSCLRSESLLQACTPTVVRQNGMVAVSLLPLDATDGVREAFERWDAQFAPRARLAQAIVQHYPGLDAQVAGTASVDVFPVGRDKSQVEALIERPVYFFADKTDVGGNDHKLAVALVQRGDASVVHTVRTWKQTWGWLKRLVAAEEGQSLSASTSRAFENTTVWL